MNKKVVVVAEVGSNHNGSLRNAADLIAAAKATGADVVKFQLFTADGLTHPSHPARDHLAKYTLPRQWLPQLRDVARHWEIAITATPFDLEAVDLLNEIEPPFIKIASGDLTYHDLIRKAAQTKRPLVISTGAATSQEVWAAKNVALQAGAPEVTLLQCVFRYPATLEQSNLRWVARGIEIDDDHVGLSDHTLSLILPAIAVGAGAQMIEKHFTISRNQIGPDHPHSLVKDEFRLMVDYIREAEKAMGAKLKEPLREELPMRIVARRGWYAAHDLPRGTRLALPDLIALRPVAGITVDCPIIGRLLARDVAAMQPITANDLDYVGDG